MNETAHIQRYLLGTLSAEERIVFEAKLLIDDELAEKAAWQRTVHETVLLSGRNRLRKEIASIDRKLFTTARYSRFQQTIRTIFHL
jgi:hypothetical protein